MILSFKELKKRDVVNIADGRSFGKITDLQLDFPCATLKGIVVSDKKRSGLFCFWRKNEIFIDEKQIVRIGGDVILVDIKHCEAITPAVVDINSNNAKINCKAKKEPPFTPSVFPCPPTPCPPEPCPPNGQDPRIDFEDY